MEATEAEGEYPIPILLSIAQWSEAQRQAVS